MGKSQPATTVWAPGKYFLCTAPQEATLEQLVFVAKMRWRIKRDYQDLKQDFGRGHYEGRGWRGFHHATLSIAAYGFLMAQRHVPNLITTLRILLSIELARALGHCPHCGLVSQRRIYGTAKLATPWESG